jgi:hypothetical protein
MGLQASLHPCRAMNRNEHLISLLEELKGRVDDNDRARIESALNAVSILSSSAVIWISFALLPSIGEVLNFTS